MRSFPASPPLPQRRHLPCGDDASSPQGSERASLSRQGRVLTGDVRRSPRRKRRDTSCSWVSISVLRDGGGQMSCARLAVWDTEDCRKVHEATLQILESVGVEVRNYPPALELFAAAGARIDGNRVRIEPPVVEKALASAPRSWLVHSRGRVQTLDLKDGNSYFGPGSDCLYIRDPDTHERRRIAQADIECTAALSRSCQTSTSRCPWGCPAMPAAHRRHGRGRRHASGDAQADHGGAQRRIVGEVALAV